MAWPDETSATTGTTAGGTAWRRARIQPNGSSDRMTVCAPASVADGAPVRLVIAFHGTGGSDATVDSGNGQTVRDALLDAGYVVVAGQLGANTWGNAESMAHLANLYAWCAARWQVTDTALFGQSQGGGVAWVATRRKLLPTLRAVAGLAPALNFQWVSDSGSSSADIRAAYGATAGTFGVQSAAYAPFAGAAADYAGVHYKLWTSLEDTTTPKALHADQFAARGLAAQAASLETVTVTGAHLSADHYRPAEVVTFYDWAIAAGNTTPMPQRAFRVWNGTAWELRTPRTWDGSGWVIRTPHAHT